MSLKGSYKLYLQIDCFKNIYVIKGRYNISWKESEKSVCIYIKSFFFLTCELFGNSSTNIGKYLKDSCECVCVLCLCTVSVCV